MAFVLMHPRAARDGFNTMYAGGGIKYQITRRQFDGLRAEIIFDDEFAAVVLRGVA